MSDLPDVKTGLDLETKQIVDGLMNEVDVEKTKDLVHLFNLNQSKKNVLRAIKYSDLLDKVSDQMADRIEHKADCFSNEDLLKYLQVIQSTIEKAGKSVDVIDETPAIQINNNKQVNVNITSSLDRDARERVSEVVKLMLSGAGENIILDDSMFKEVEEDSDGQSE